MVPFERYTSSRGLATLLGIGRNKMMEALRRADILGPTNIPEYWFISKYPGILEVREGGFGKYSKATTYFNREFLNFFREVVKKYYV